MSLGEEMSQEAEIADLRRQLLASEGKLKRAKAKTNDLIDAVYQAAKDAALRQGKARALTPKADPRRKAPEVALAHLTDLQYGKQTDSFSMEVCEARVNRFALKVAKLTDIQRADHPVKECHVMLGGDMVEGVGIFPGQVYEVEAYLYEQMFGCARMIESFLLTLLESFDLVTVWEESGNHGRLGRKGENPGGDNVDRMVYTIVRGRMTGESRLVWNPQDNWHKIVEVGNYHALLVHGDEIKGFGGNLPAYGILRKSNAWSAGVVAPFSDVYMGHFHQVMSLSMANGNRVFITGSPESDNVYAQEFVAAKGRPSQRLHFIDPEEGRVTSEHIIWLDG